MAASKEDMRLSKLMSKMLRHTPGDFGLILDREGFCPLGSFLNVLNRVSGFESILTEDVQRVVRESEKQRFEIADGHIRARYGHSHERITYDAAEPPPVLYHGTNRQAVPQILSQGILPMSRQYVHLSEGLHFASLAGKRRGELVILEVDTARARQDGIRFYYAGNEVWLADRIPADCCCPLSGS
ncbi:RNA 2'-phosphotransferase [Paenibacillus sp. UNC499MF]|uniref:RNA 2'-phosphotransferase n=1 Tax=Paenibacillus sp. UNC499MF TaxID=1502751 RepID=UPI0008A03F85|nr:RNA 2'-phosphotransferase [Paenibacillus sp. UNC499MF]SEG46698.1 putative RNA 2'-phosphotransferase [Paenibacillus sp. UNC499MF]